MRGHNAVRAAALALLLGLAGCENAEGPVSVTCGSVAPADPEALADTLEVTLVLGERPRRRTDVLVRVDPLSERGAVFFTGTPPESAAAVSASVTTDAVFHGCVNERADGFRLRAEKAPIGRVWVKVSSNRPVAVRLLTEASTASAGATPPDPSETTREPEETTRGDEWSAVLVVAPGASGRRPWPGDAPSGSQE